MVIVNRVVARYHTLKVIRIERSYEGYTRVRYNEAIYRILSHKIINLI